jgi:hypothetical protein
MEAIPPSPIAFVVSTGTIFTLKKYGNSGGVTR